MARELDEDDVPFRRTGRTRPRSKQRPDRSSATEGVVVTVDRGRITCALKSDPTIRVVAVRARELGRKSVVVGDHVGLVGDLSGRPDSLARLVRIDPRRNSLRRTADDNDPYERVIVANVDQMAVVVAAADPPPRIGLIDRCLAAAFDANIAALLIVTKSDLASPTELLDLYQGFDISAVQTSPGCDLAPLRQLLSAQSTVFVGHSGVGKSTLINELVPAADRRTGHVNVATGRGRHTSTSAEAFSLPFGGWIIDTPGIRSFGLAHLQPDRVVAAFEELAGGLIDCPRGCTHDEEECGLDAWVETGHADPKRLESLRRILRAQADPAG